MKPNVREFVENYFESNPNAVYGSCLVFMRYKFKQDANWIYDTEILQYIGNEDSFVWLNDWYEGQDFVEYLGVISVDAIPESIFWKPSKPVSVQPNQKIYNINIDNIKITGNRLEEHFKQIANNIYKIYKENSTLIVQSSVDFLKIFLPFTIMIEPTTNYEEVNLHMLTDEFCVFSKDLSCNKYPPDIFEEYFKLCDEDSKCCICCFKEDIPGLINDFLFNLYDNITNELPEFETLSIVWQN